MKRIVAVAVIVSFAWVAAWAQEDTGTLADNSPSVNNSPGNVQARAPGTWVTAARARHQAYIQARVGNARAGQPAGTLEGLSGGTSGTTTGGLSDLLDLATQLGGSSGDLSGLLDSLTGGGTSTSTGGTTGGTTGGSGMTIADLLALRDQLMGSVTSKLNTRAQLQAPDYETQTGSGAIGRLPKLDLYAQSQDTTERKFVARWADRMVQTVFTSLTIGFQSQEFIDFLKDALRPIFNPPAASGTDGDNSGDGSDGGSGTDGGGIEDINNPSDGGDGGSGSIV